jgi:dystrophin
MSCKTSIDDVQQLAQTIENEYDIQAINRTQELNQRWEHSIQSVSQRVQVLQDSIRNFDTDIYSNSVEYPWQRSVAFNKVPYFINHSDQSTSWDHPKMLELMRSFSELNDIRFSAYRTAMKLRTLQKRLCLDLTSLSDIISVFEEHQTLDSPNRNIEKYIDITEIVYYLQSIFEKTANEYPQLINVILTVDLTLNWLLNIYDINRSGSIRLLAMKMALALLCRGNIEEKYRYIFSLVAYPSSGNDVVDRQHLSILFQQAIVIPKQLGEVAAFGGSSVEPSVKSCFDYARNPDFITADDFLEWVKLEPQSLVWLPVMHRLAASEAAKHEARCNICKIYPILGFRYRSLKYFNCDICQNCFFSGKQTKFFKMDDPLQEYYTETTSSEDIRDFFRIFKNKLWTKHRKHPKLGYLPLPHVFDNNISTTPQQQQQQQPSPSPVLIPVLTSPYKSDLSNVQSIEPTDEHGIIAQHCRNLNSFVHTSPRAAAHDILTRSRSLDNEQRNELEAIIRDLEEENRLLQNEYENLCQQHMEKSLIINDQQHFHRSDSQLGSSSLINEYNSNDREMLREAKQLRHHKTKLEQRMKILEEHNKQLEKQLRRSKQLLFRESPSLHHHTSSSSMTEHRPMTTPSPLHSSTLGLRRSVERNLERQPNLITIDNLFHMADDINRAVGDLVSVITEPQSNGSSAYYQQLDTSIVT